MNRKHFGVLSKLAAVGALGMTSLVTLGTSASSSAATSSFKILAVIDTSGPVAIYGQQQLIALHASVYYWNRHGGIDGHKIQMSYVNGNGDPATAETALINWVSSNGKPNEIMDLESGVDDAGIPAEVKRLGVLDIGQDSANACATNAPVNCPTRFVPVPTTATNMAATAAFFKSKGVTSVGLLNEEDGFSESEVPILQAALTKVGITSVVQSFAATAVDVTPEMQSLKSAGVGAIWGAALGPSAAYIANARFNLGMTIPLAFDAGAGAQDLTSIIPAAQLTNVFESVGRPQVAAVPEPGRTDLYASAVADGFNPKLPFGGMNEPLPVSIVWDSFVLMRDAAAQAKSIKTSAMVKALLSLNKTGQNDPLYMYANKMAFTKSIHQDVAATPATYSLVPVAPLNAEGEVSASK